MGVAEETRQIIQDFPASELRELRGVLTSIDKRLDSVDKRLDPQDKRLDAIEEANRARFESIVQRLDQIQQSFAFDKRISDLESKKKRSA